jgi:hypothetical protein
MHAIVRFSLIVVAATCNFFYSQLHERQQQRWERNLEMRTLIKFSAAIDKNSPTCTRSESKSFNFEILLTINISITIFLPSHPHTNPDHSRVMCGGWKIILLPFREIQLYDFCARMVSLCVFRSNLIAPQVSPGWGDGCGTSVGVRAKILILFARQNFHGRKIYL